MACHKQAFVSVDAVSMGKLLATNLVDKHMALMLPDSVLELAKT